MQISTNLDASEFLTYTANTYGSSLKFFGKSV